MKVGFIGLGYLGKAMARRLISEGVELSVWNRTKEKAADLKVEMMDSPAALISKVDVLFMNLFDSNAVRDVIGGERGILQGDCDGKIIIDTTTNHFQDVLDFHETFEKVNAAYIEAPVLGSVIPASKGLLTVLVSGRREAYEKCLPLLEKIGSNIFYLEERGMATKMKLINNMLLGSFMASIAEAVVLGEEIGLPKEKVLDILSKGAGDSLVLNVKKEKLLKEDFSTHFKVALIYKDLHYLQDLARFLKKPLFTGSTAKELYGITLSRNLEDLDFSVIYKIMKEL
jgi:3-hydroxyisobutyrate dehydrogenase